MSLIIFFNQVTRALDDSLRQRIAKGPGQRSNYFDFAFLSSSKFEIISKVPSSRSHSYISIKNTSSYL